jgi:hypothetical protein
MLKDAWGAECPDGIWCIRMVCTKRRIIPKIGTQFTEVYDVKVSGFAKLLASTIDSKIRKDLKQNLINVKGILEAET